MNYEPRDPRNTGLYDGPDLAREDEEHREKRWTEFVTLMRGVLEEADHNVADLFLMCCDVFHGEWSDPFDAHTPEYAAIAAFVDEFGWPATLHAIAQALSEHEASRAALVDRR